MGQQDDLAAIIAKMYAERNWYKLSADEREIVKLLEESGHLTTHNSVAGFVGKVKAAALKKNF